MAKCFLYASGKIPKGLILVTTDPNCTVTCKKGSRSADGVSNSGVWAFVVGLGTWTITATLNGVSKTQTVVMDEEKEVEIEISFSVIPSFTYTGRYQIVNDSDQAITESTNNWKIRFLSSGILRFSELKGASAGIDVFLVGGGGGGGYGSTFASGGGGGYTKTQKGVSVALNTDYQITVGDGGAPITTGDNYTFGGESSAFGYSANGGQSGYASTYVSSGKGGNGGSGGGAGMYGGSNHVSGDGHGGEDGSDGGSINHNGTTAKGGTGQGTTTREFGESTGTLYSGGGGGGSYAGYSGYNPGKGGEGGGGDGGEHFEKAVAGTANTGGGGGGAGYGSGVYGGSGIVIIRNAR
jgi:hypothetical protein